MNIVFYTDIADQKSNLACQEYLSGNVISHLHYCEKQNKKVLFHNTDIDVEEPIELDGTLMEKSDVHWIPWRMVDVNSYVVISLRLKYTTNNKSFGQDWTGHAVADIVGTWHETVAEWGAWHTSAPACFIVRNG